MKTNWPTVNGWMGLSEGGFVNDPDDSGGPTNHGITHKTLAAWRGKKSVTIAQVKALTKAEASEILKTQYWDIANCDALRSGVDYAVCDYAVNSGPNRASKDLQRSLNKLFSAKLGVDGQIGLLTIAAVNQLSIKQTVDLIKEYCERRWEYMKSIKSWWKHKNGWTIRVMGKVMGVQTNDIGVIDRASMLATESTPIESIPSPVPLEKPTGKAMPEKPTFIDAVKKPSAWGPLAGLLSALGAITQGDGPFQWALSALVIAFIAVGTFYAIKQIKNMDPA